MIKVALVNPPLTAHQMRGTGIYAKNLLLALDKISDLEIISVESSYLPKDVNLYHFPYFDPFFLTLPLWRSRKTLVTIHDLIPIKYPEHFPRGIKGELKWQIQKRLLTAVDAVITDSRSSKQDIEELAGLKSSVIYSVYLAPVPIFTKVVSETSLERVRHKFQLPQKFALYVGDANWNKNLPNIIKAITLTKFPLVIVSKAFTQKQDSWHPWKESLLQARQLVDGKTPITKVGQIDETDLAAIYQSAQVLLMPSYSEGFGLPVVEAMASGCPVICSDRGSLPEVAGEAAIYVDPDNIEQIVQALVKVFAENEFRYKLVKSGKKQARKFSWEKTARETFAVYKKVIDNK